jgi:hypothetical protein
MTESALKPYRGAVRADVCSICACREHQSPSDPFCRHEAEGTCAIFSQLPAIVDTLAPHDGAPLEEYEQALRTLLCTRCPRGAADGSCPGHDSTRDVPDWCVVDAYLPQLISAIERTHTVPLPLAAEA